MGRWAVEQGRRKLYLRVVGMLLGGRRRPEPAHTAAASKWQRPYSAGAWSERTAGTADRDEMPQRRRTERRCTSFLFAGGWDAARSLTNTERERPRRPCVRLCDETHERQTHFPFSPRQSFYILGMVPDPPSSKQPLHASNYHVGCLFVQKRTPPCTRTGVAGNET